VSKIRLYLDEDIQEQALILALRNSGVDVITTSEANRLSFSDEEQLIWATEQGRVVYSFNRRDFSRLHNICIAEERSHTGIILAQQQRYSVGGQLRGLLNLIAAKSAEEMIDQLEYLGTYIRDE
jgi:DNA-binding transcriptional MerR regulator